MQMLKDVKLKKYLCNEWNIEKFWIKLFMFPNEPLKPNYTASQIANYMASQIAIKVSMHIPPIHKVDQKW